MRYGFDKHGGFLVVDDERRVASYSYPTSPNAEAARKNPAARAAKIMSVPEPLLGGIYAEIMERNYLRAVEALKEIES